ncbi:hypothetical protein E6C67_18050 [Azospirillum sp. TSA2s]|nr:hypothetical protein E6C67_18050 [Azospirillum sp. TSA2s]
MEDVEGKGRRHPQHVYPSLPTSHLTMPERPASRTSGPPKMLAHFGSPARRPGRSPGAILDPARSGIVGGLLSFIDRRERC